MHVAGRLSFCLSYLGQVGEVRLKITNRRKGAVPQCRQSTRRGLLQPGGGHLSPRRLFPPPFEPPATTAGTGMQRFYLFKHTLQWSPRLFRAASRTEAPSPWQRRDAARSRGDDSSLFWALGKDEHGRTRSRARGAAPSRRPACLLSDDRPVPRDVAETFSGRDGRVIKPTSQQAARRMTCDVLRLRPVGRSAAVGLERGRAERRDTVGVSACLRG